MTMLGKSSIMLTEILEPLAKGSKMLMHLDLSGLQSTQDSGMLRLVHPLFGVGPALAALRKRRKLTQGQLGERLGVRFSSVGRMETDDANPTADSIGAYLAALEFSLIDLAREIATLRDGQVAEAPATYGEPAAAVDVIAATYPSLSPDATLELARALAAATLRAQDLEARLARLEQNSGSTGK